MWSIKKEVLAKAKSTRKKQSSHERSNLYTSNTITPLQPPLFPPNLGCSVSDTTNVDNLSSVRIRTQNSHLTHSPKSRHKHKCQKERGFRGPVFRSAKLTEYLALPERQSASATVLTKADPTMWLIKKEVLASARTTKNKQSSHK
jgi:hypothetical protein